MNASDEMQAAATALRSVTTSGPVETADLLEETARDLVRHLLPGSLSREGRLRSVGAATVIPGQTWSEGQQAGIVGFA
jgi:hypothetical protein